MQKRQDHFDQWQATDVRCQDAKVVSRAAGSGASRASLPSCQQQGGKQDRQGADAGDDGGENAD
jgi:hypothetical protein